GAAPSARAPSARARTSRVRWRRASRKPWITSTSGPATRKSSGSRARSRNTRTRSTRTSRKTAAVNRRRDMRPVLSAVLAIMLGSVIFAQQDQGDRKPIKDSQLRVEADLQKLDAKMAELIDQLRKKDQEHYAKKL